jgi:SAM-dependent methyltransferase
MELYGNGAARAALIFAFSGVQPKMKIMDLIERVPFPEPWSEGDHIPWNDPDFSRRMLEEHLTQDHDAASRRFEIIEHQVYWMQEALLGDRPAKILDLGCGPGLYANRMAYLGHTVCGFDFSPASIAHARAVAAKENLANTFTEADMRQADYGENFDFAMLIYGEFNIFKPADAALILQKIFRALKPGGLLLLEPQDLASLQRARKEPPIWRAYRQGLFSDRPHLYLTENFWDARTSTMTTRYWVVDAASGEVSRYASTAQGYTDADLEGLLLRHGFGDVCFYPALAPLPGQARQEFFGVTAVRP